MALESLRDYWEGFMEDMFRFTDEFGPARIIHIHRSHVGLKAIAVVDNTACGPAIGGVRMAPDVSTEECFRLARAMTWKNAAAGLPHGGGKSVIVGGRPPSIPCARRANASENAESDRRRDAGRNSCGRDGGRLQLSFPKSAWIQCSFSA